MPNQNTDVLGHVENNPHPLGVLDPRYSVGMHRPLSGDRYILSEDEAFCRESKAKLVVVGSFDIVEIPLPTRLAAKMANPFGLTIVEPPYAALLLVSSPRVRVDVAILGKRNEDVIPAAFIARWSPFFAGENKPDLAKLRRQLRRGHERHLTVGFRYHPKLGFALTPIKPSHVPTTEAPRVCQPPSHRCHCKKFDVKGQSTCAADRTPCDSIGCERVQHPRWLLGQSRVSCQASPPRVPPHRRQAARRAQKE